MAIKQTPDKDRIRPLMYLSDEGFAELVHFSDHSANELPVIHLAITVLIQDPPHSVQVLDTQSKTRTVYLYTRWALLGWPVRRLVNAMQIWNQPIVWQTWSRCSAVVQTKCQNGKEMWSKWLRTWTDCWCQAGWFEYLENCWSPVRSQRSVEFAENGTKKWAVVLRAETPC